MPIMNSSEDPSLEEKKDLNWIRYIRVSILVAIILGCCFIVYVRGIYVSADSYKELGDFPQTADRVNPDSHSNDKDENQIVLGQKTFLNETIHMMLKKKHSGVKQFDIKYPLSCEAWEHYKAQDVDKTILIYSKYPKSGSTTLSHLLYNITLMSGVNFRYTLSKKALGYTGITGLQNHIEMIQDYPKPVVYIAHAGFLDFTKFGYKQPVYIDVVREPVEQAISMFYFLKQCEACHGKQNISYSETIKLNISDYIDKYGVDKLPRKSQIKWFSGIDGTKNSINIAKQNIEKHYLFIGVQEYYNETMKALEKVLPLFKGHLQSGLRKGTTTHFKSPPTTRQLYMMRKKYALDYDLYHFIVKRFHETLKYLHIP